MTFLNRPYSEITKRIINALLHKYEKPYTFLAHIYYTSRKKGYASYKFKNEKLNRRRILNKINSLLLIFSKSTIINYDDCNIF